MALFWLLVNRNNLGNTNVPKTEKAQLDLMSDSEGKKKVLCLLIDYRVCKCLGSTFFSIVDFALKADWVDGGCVEVLVH